MSDKTPEEALYTALYDTLKAFVGRDAPMKQLEVINRTCKRLSKELQVQSQRDAAIVCQRLQDNVAKGFAATGKHIQNLDKRLREVESKLKTLETDKPPPNM